MSGSPATDENRSQAAKMAKPFEDQIMKRRNLIATTALALATTVASSAYAAQKPVLLAQATATEEAPKAVEEEGTDKAAKKAARKAAKKAKKEAAEEAGAEPKAVEIAPKAEEAAAEPKAEEPAVKAEEATPEPKAEEAPAKAETEEAPAKKNEQAEAEPAAEEAPKAEAKEAEAPAKPVENAEQPAAAEAVKEVEQAKPKKKKKKKKQEAAAPAEDKPEKPAATTEAEPANPVTEEAAKPAQPAATNNSEAAAEQTAATEAPVVVEADQSAEKQAAAQAAERERRAEKKKRRRELIGAGVAGVAVGAVLQGVLGGKVVEDEGDRIVVERDGRYFVRKDENVLLRRNGVEVRTEELAQGRQRSVATRPNGVEIVTLRDRNGNILKRSKRFPNGDEVVLIDNQDLGDYAAPEGLNLGELQLGIPLDDYVVETTRADRRAYRRALLAEPVEEVERDYSLREVRDNRRLRAKVRRIDLDSINFNTGSATVSRSQIEKLDELGATLAAIIEEKPGEVFLIEGHTDAVGSNLSNLTLSDRRAETVAQILIGSYRVPPENLVTEGYGEQDLKVNTEEASAENRRVTVRRITPLLKRASN